MPDIIAQMKGQKNAIEIQNLKQACLFESAVICKFLAFVEEQKETITELDCVKELKGLRAQNPMYIADSFDVIAASGPHAAQAHYLPTPSTSCFIRKYPLLLVDTGGQLKMHPRKEIPCGSVGYIISGIKTAVEVKVGDTITHVGNSCAQAIEGFEEVKPMVFAGMYPVETDQYEELRASLEKFQLNDASLVFEPESSLALGFGFRCGFLGLLHLEIVQERLFREFNMDVITTVPNVSYKVYTTQGECLDVHNPSGLPAATLIDRIEEPYIRAQVISRSDYYGPIMKLCLDKRGVLINQHYLTADRLELTYEMPLSEIVFDFYDKLKSISKGYASFDYHVIGFKEAKLVKLDILLNGDPADALSTLIHADHAYDFGRKMCEKLKELIPRQQFDIAIQAAVGAKIIARETVKAVRKDVTAKCYGGDISRKRKLLEKQKQGKKRMRQIGTVEVPQSAFMAVLKLD